MLWFTFSYLFYVIFYNIYCSIILIADFHHIPHGSNEFFVALPIFVLLYDIQYNYILSHLLGFFLLLSSQVILFEVNTCAMSYMPEDGTPDMYPVTLRVLLILIHSIYLVAYCNLL